MKVLIYLILGVGVLAFEVYRTGERPRPNLTEIAGAAALVALWPAFLLVGGFFVIADRVRSRL